MWSKINFYAIYSIFLVIVVAVSALLSGVAYMCVNAFIRLRDRFLELLGDGRERAMNFVHIRNYFTQRR